MKSQQLRIQSFLTWATLCVASGAAFLALSGIVSFRYTLPVAIALLALNYAQIQDRATRRLMWIISAAMVCVLGLDVLGMGSAASIYSIADRIQAFALVLAILMAFWGQKLDSLEEFSRAWDGRRIAALILVIGFALVGFRWFLGGPQAFTADENIYLFQSYHGLNDLRGMKVEPWLEPFFRIRQTYVRDGFLNGQYPPGWPIVLGLFTSVGLASVAGVVVCIASTVALAYWVRMLRGSWEVAAVAIALGATPFAQIYFNTSYLSHGISTFFALAAAISALAASRASGYRGAGLWFLAASLVSLLAAVRPLTGLVGALLMLNWIWISGCFRFPVLVASSLGLSLFGLPLLAFNWRTTGHPLRFGYDLAQAGLQSPGFGLRGSIGFSSEGMAEPNVWNFSALDGLQAFFELVGASVMTFWPGGLIFALLAISLDRREFNWRISAKWVLGCLALPAAYAFYAFSFPRLVIEILPFAAAGTALWAGYLLRCDERMTRVLIWVTVIVGFVFSLGRIVRFQQTAQTRNAYIEVVQDLRDEYGPLLVYVRRPTDGFEQSNYENGLEALFWFNAQPDEQVVVGRDIERLRSRIRDHYPGHTAVLFLSGRDRPNGAWEPPEIHILESLDAE